jgi:hypothetical protein
MIRRWIFLGIRNASGKVVEEIKTRVLCSIIFVWKSCRLWDNETITKSTIYSVQTQLLFINITSYMFLLIRSYYQADRHQPDNGNNYSLKTRTTNMCMIREIFAWFLCWEGTQQPDGERKYNRHWWKSSVGRGGGGLLKMCRDLEVADATRNKRPCHSHVINGMIVSRN